MRQRGSEFEGEFAGLVAVVTGAARGIGRAIAEELHQRGARLLMVDCDEAGLAATAESMRTLGAPAVDCAVTDLKEPEAIRLLATQIADLEKNVDVLVNNAGIEHDVPFAEVTWELFDRVVAVNLRAPLLLTQALTRVRGNKTAAADLLGLKRTTLAAKMKALESRFSVVAA